MKNKAWNRKIRIRLMAAGLAGTLSLGLWGCKTADTCSSPGTVSMEELPQEQSAETDTGSRGSAAAGKETAPEENAQEAYDLYGEIREVSAQTFVLSRVMEEDAGDGAEIAVLPVEEDAMELVTVVWDENTRFVKRTIKNGGADYEDSESSPEALEAGAMAELQGSYEGEVFRASQVRLTETM